MPMIVPQHSIRSVTLGMDQAAVIRVIGKPDGVTHGTNDAGRYTELRYRGLVVTLAPAGAVSQVETTSARDRTVSGAGVGSTEGFLREHVRGLKCVTEGAVRHCHLGVYRAGKVVTDFFIRRGKVWRIVVGRVLD